VLRVVVTGSESTGKTALAARLAARYGTAWSAEFSRAYADAKGEPLIADDVEPIARGQMALEDEAVRAARRVAVHDTDLLSTAVYAAHYYGVRPAWMDEALRARRPHLYLLAGIDAPWTPGPHRDRGHLRPEMHALFLDAVRATGAPFVEIHGDWDERFRRAAEAVDALLAGEK
jgi:NadR type nicotinamide-nucleotide adenylyltransferase